MKLERPIVFFDLETTGVNPSTDRIVEIAILKHREGGTEIITKRVNPTIPISEEATAVHDITDEMVKDLPTFRDVANEIAEFMVGCDLGGYNVLKFDLPILAEEFGRCGVSFPEDEVKVIDVYKIFALKEPRTLTGAYKHFCGKDLEGAHGAEADIIATHEVFLSQILHYPDLPDTVAGLDEFCRDGKEFIDLAGKVVRDKNGDLVFSFGKNKGKRVVDERAYVNWMLSSDFSHNTKGVLNQITNGELT